MKLVDFRNIKYTNIAILLLISILLIALFWFVLNSLNIVSDTNKNNFTYTVKVRNTIEEIDKIVERAQVNLDVLKDTAILSYDTGKIFDEKYNENYLNKLNFIVKSVLINSPGVEGAWFQTNLDTPFSGKSYSWFSFKNGKIVNLKKLLDKTSNIRKLNPKDDPYYFEAIRERKTVWSNIYTDFDTKVTMLTISTPVYKNNKLIGVAGIDISVKNLQQALRNMQNELYGSEIFLLDSKKKILLYQLFNGEKHTEIDSTFSKLFVDKAESQEEMIEYYDNGIKKTAILLTLSNKYNIVITFQNSIIYSGFNRLLKAIYLILALITILSIMVLINRKKIISINKQLENEISTQKNIINSNPAIVIIKNIEGVYIECNDKFLTLVGQAKEDIIGKTDYDIFNKETADFIVESDKTAQTNKQITINEHWHTNINGDKILLKKYRVPLFNKENELFGVLVTAVDITNYRMEQELLRQAKEAAEKANDMKSNFLANMSHEIRTPMNGVFGFLQLLEETETTPIQKEFIADAQKSSEHLLTIINEILDFSKIEAGKLHIDNTSFDIRSAVEDVTIMETSNANSKGIDINCLICSDVPQKVFGDPGRVKQILNNLVGNAIKFTKKGEVVIYVNQVSETDDISVISFTVKDTGIGIPEAKLKLIFESFTQADDSTTRQYGGTGLGLAISKKLTDLMGGSITVESKENEGSTFTLIIPFKKDKMANQIAHETIKTLNGANILLVDNSPTDLKIIRYYLNEANCIINEAHSIEEALGIVNKEHNNISVALIDYKMEETGGAGLSTLMKNEEYSQNIPLILYASLAKRGDAILAKQKGFVGYLTKPIRKNELIESIALAIENKNNNAQNTFITKHLIKENKFNDKAKILVVEDCELNCKLVVQILANADLSCDIAVDGDKAVEAFKAKKYDLILMDCEMPIMGGYEATREIRKIERGSGQANIGHIPIIAMTANVLTTDKEKCYESGMDNYISKPIKINQLLDLIGEYIQVRPEHSKINQINPNTKKDTYIENIIIEMMSELGFKSDEALQLFNLYMEMLPQSISELEITLENNDFEKLKRLAHKLKGSSGNLRIKRFAQLSKDLETVAAENNKIQCLNIINEMKNHLNYINQMHAISKNV